MNRHLVASTALILTGTPIWASDCLGDGSGQLPKYSESAAALADAVICDEEDRSCRFSFGLATDVSRDLYDQMVGNLSTCPGLKSAEQDVGVNHPDFYDAWTFQFGDGVMTVSIKDKSALKQTFVVLRIMSETGRN